MVDTRYTAWTCGWFEKVPRIRIRIVDGLKRCPEYGLGCGWAPVCGLGIWMA
jgi:hypothetical protein